jgi:Ctf8
VAAVDIAAPAARFHQPLLSTAGSLMLVPVHAGADCREYCIIELQGEVHHEANLKQGFCVGTMSACPKNQDTVYLQIGYHRLEGKQVTLKQPIALLRKSVSNHAGPEGDEGAAQQAAVPAFHVHGHIRSKYIFKSRPKALISQVG